MLSWYGISIAFGIICILFIAVLLAYLVWNTRQLVTQINNKWKNVKIASGRPNESRLRAVRNPGDGKMLQLTLGGTVSSTSSVHPTKETWLNMQNSGQMSSNNATERTTMRDLQEMFAPVPQEDCPGTSSKTFIDEGVYTANVMIEKPEDSSA